jgi:hypothetical protein
VRRFRRLIGATAGQERMLQTEVARLETAWRGLQARMEALQPGPPTSGAHTAAELVHQQRYREQAARQCEELETERLQHERQWRAERRRLTEMAQTRRAFELLVARLERAGELAARRHEQQALDEHAQARGAR